MFVSWRAKLDLLRIGLRHFSHWGAWWNVHSLTCARQCSILDALVHSWGMLCLSLLYLLLLHLGFSNQFRHVRAWLRHLENLLLLLRDVRVQIIGHLSIENCLLISNIHHGSQLVLHSFELVHLGHLSLFHLFILKELFTLLENVLPHGHSLFKVLIPVLQDLLESLLVHSDHLLLIFEHFTGLRLLLTHPVRLSLHLLIGERGWRRRLELA